MKKRITVEQLKELNKEQQNKLRKWWNVSEFDVFYVDGWNRCDVVGEVKNSRIISWDDEVGAEKEDCLPLLDIGQMVELVQYFSDWTMDMERDDYTYRVDVAITENKDGFLSERMELCDALWEAVKQVL